MKLFLKKGHMEVKQDDFGFLVSFYIQAALRPNFSYDIISVEKRLREWWPTLEEYYQRKIITSIEMAIELHKPPRYNREPLEHEMLWQQFVRDFRPPPSAFTIDYHCNKCKVRGVKLWRGVHGASDKDGNELLCASCLAPGDLVSDNGTWQEPPYKAKDAYGNEIPGMVTDQVKGWLPAIPVGDTYWGYTSVPSQDVEWWVGLLTYPSKQK